MPGSFVLSLKKDQQNHVFKNKRQNNKKTKFLIVFNFLLRIISHHTGTSQTDLMCKSVDWFQYNRQTI